ncbi:hypothetical protein GCM10010277_77320 [Streptomyces longisporoflavus]|nr:hypothetical protein GCM10010277_77320 [Streptomyces longisporoflavus]
MCGLLPGVAVRGLLVGEEFDDGSEDVAHVLVPAVVTDGGSPVVSGRQRALFCSVRDVSAGLWRR